jgi:acyl-CoA dehydrogenase
MYSTQRTLRLADGPDEVHHLVVGRHELGIHGSPQEDAAFAASFRS